MPKVVNAVGGGDLGEEIDLRALNDVLEGEEVRYDPEYWPGLYVRLDAEAPAVMLFRTGKYNIAGADSIDELHDTKDEILSRLHDLGIGSHETGFEVRNLVFLDYYPKEIDLSQAAVGIGFEQTEYEPEQFPGMIIRYPELQGTLLLFRTGKVLLTGSPSPSAGPAAFERLFSDLDRLFAE